MYQGEKSHVGMNNCYFCGGPNEILIDRRLRNTLTSNMGVMSTNPCGECSKIMEEAIIFISISNDTKDEEMKKSMPNPYRTGGWAAIKEEAVKKFMKGNFLDFALKHRFMFITDEAWDAIGIPREAIDNREEK